MRQNQLRFAAVSLLFLASGCTRPASSDAATSDTTSQPVTAADSATARTGLTVTATGYGALRVGMTVKNAATALGSPVPSMAGLDTACAYASFDNQPAGMRIMVVRGNVARLEVDSASIATGLGVRVGDPESRVKELYGSRVVVKPHKYDPTGHYLIVNPIPPTDTGYEMVFETDSGRVTKYRVGRVPEVEWVEGCS
ncbi:MAG: hypothetical protein ABI035_02660 [Gemmatimonadaceae bacterium]